MTDATVNPTPAALPPVGVELKDSAVILDGVDAKLIAALRVIGLVHLHLFDCPVIVTSARDQEHGVNSKHYKGLAVDLRLSDLRASWYVPFLSVLYVLSDRFGLAIFDEHNLAGSSHVHVELAG